GRARREAAALRRGVSVLRGTVRSPEATAREGEPGPAGPAKPGRRKGDGGGGHRGGEPRRREQRGRRALAPGRPASGHAAQAGARLARHAGGPETRMTDGQYHGTPPLGRKTSSRAASAAFGSRFSASSSSRLSPNPKITQAAKRWSIAA